MLTNIISDIEETVKLGGGDAEIHDSGRDRLYPTVAIQPAALFDL